LVTGVIFLMAWQSVKWHFLPGTLGKAGNIWPDS
jgi:hypothetical protein